MRKLNLILASFSILALMFLAGCDKVKDNDLIQTTTLNTSIYVQPNGSALLDLAALAKNGTTEVKILKNAEKGSITIDQGKWLKYMPSSSFKSGSDNFTLLLNSKETTFTAVVDSTNTVSSNMGAQFDKTITQVGNTVGIKVLANDVFSSGANASRLEIAKAPQNGTTKISDGVVYYTPAAGFVGMDVFVYTVSANNAADGSGSAEVYVYVEDPSVCKFYLMTDYFISSGNSPVTIDVLANDSICNRSNVTVYIGQQPMNGTASVQNGVVVYQPNQNFAGTDFFEYIVKDAKGNKYLGYVKGEVSSFDNGIVPCTSKGVMPDKTQTMRDSSVWISATDNDQFCSGVDLSTLALALQPANGMAKIEGGKILYKPNSGFSGVDKFTYFVSANKKEDGSGTAEVYVNVYDVSINDSCTSNLLPDIFETTTGTDITVDVLANDQICSASRGSLTIQYLPQNGTATVENGKIHYQPNPGYKGWDKLLYALTDANGNVFYGTMYGEIK